MSWILIIVVIIFLFSIFSGWRRGILRLLFSLVSFLVMIWLISKVTPFISSFLKNYTGIYDAIERWCASAMENRLGSSLAFLTDATAGVMADWILKGLTFLIALIVALIVIAIIFRLIGLVNRVPVLKGINRGLGLIGGAVEGYLIVCLLMLLVSLISGTVIGENMMGNIEGNAFLSFLYNNNILMNLKLFR